MTLFVLDVALYYGMKSRHDILEELDIRCGQLSSSRSPHRSALMKNTPNMVKGAHLYVLPMVFMAFVTVTSCLGGQIKKFTYNNNGFGTYSFEYETSDGTYRREDGGILPGPAGRSLVVRGEYGYIDSEGKPYSMKYVADANGYQPRINDDHTSEDVELRRIFPSEFPQDTIRKTGNLDPEHLGRTAELKNYFRYPKSKVNSHFEELVCYNKDDRKLCRIDLERYSPDEDAYYTSSALDSHVDRRRVYCFMLLCFTEDELDRVVASF